MASPHLFHRLLEGEAVRELFEKTIFVITTTDTPRSYLMSQNIMPTQEIDNATPDVIAKSIKALRRAGGTILIRARSKGDAKDIATIVWPNKRRIHAPVHAWTILENGNIAVITCPATVAKEGARVREVDAQPQAYKQDGGKQEIFAI